MTSSEEPFSGEPVHGEPVSAEPVHETKIPTKPTLADKALPPVEAPTAGFILQLFLIPLMIVSIIVMVWLSFSWLAHMGSNPRDLVKGLKRGDDAAWQKAGILADLLRDERKEHLKLDEALANEVASTLEAQIDEGSRQPHQIKLRIFLCRVLGEFRVESVLPALLTAAITERDNSEIETQNRQNASQRKLTEIDVRRAALEALATLIANVGAEKFRNDERLLKVLSEASRERGDPARDEYLRRELRSTAAFALGVLGGEDALARLERLLDDPYPNARYNAATGLARHGDIRAIPELVDMLDPENEEAAEDEQHESGIEFKRSLVITNAVQATLLLAEKNEANDLRQLKDSLQKLAKSDVPFSVQVRAREAQNLLAQRESK